MYYIGIDGETQIFAEKAEDDVYVGSILVVKKGDYLCVGEGGEMFNTFADAFDDIYEPIDEDKFFVKKAIADSERLRAAGEITGRIVYGGK